MKSTHNFRVSLAMGVLVRKTKLFLKNSPLCRRQTGNTSCSIVTPTFLPVFEEPFEKPYFQFTNVYRILLSAESNTDESDEAAEASCRVMETTIAESLSSFERVWPQVLISGPVLHTLIHYPRFIYRWNSVRNYWCYFNERSFCTATCYLLLDN